MARFVEVSVSYPIPHNWKWDSIGNYAKIKSGYPFDSEKFSDDPTGRQPLIRIRDILRESTNTFTDECCPEEYIIHAGDILIGMDGDFNVGKWNGDDALLNQRVCYIQSNSNCLLNDYLYYYLPGILKIINNATPSVTVKHLSANTLRKTQIPLPPLAEQQRIVDRIESLFARLDEAKEKAQTVVDSFETRKAAILHKAFTGELTAKWRRTHGLSLDTWKEVAADSLFEYVTSGSRGWAKYYDESGAVFIRMGNLDHGTIELDFSDIQHVKLPNKAEGQRSRIRKNDILISITADVGMVGLVRNDDFEGYINQHIALARPVMSESAEFIAWYLVSDIGLKQMQEKQRGATKAGLSLNDIRALQLKIPLIEEQNEILKVIKMWIGKEQQSQEAAEAVLDQIDLMKKSILARAFRGELGTNDPSEESAVELLKRTIL